MSIEQEHNCLGYFGFGNGISMYGHTGIMYCNGCPLNDSCWQMHRARVHKILPFLAAHIDKLGRKPDSKKLIGKFVKKHGHEPFMSIMMGNMEDGLSVAGGGQPKDRGKHTLKYPFKK